MFAKPDSPLLLFYPTSPVHVMDIGLLMQKLPEWRCLAVLNHPLARVAPGIDSALRQHGIGHVDLDTEPALEEELPTDVRALLLGAVFEHFALELFAWAKQRELPVFAIEEVAQLALNQLDINNYDAPFDRLFLASPEERRLFLKLGYPSDMLCVSGLLANDRCGATNGQRNKEILERLGITDGKNPIVYTTSPVRGRLALHNKDDRPFRDAVLAQIADVSRRTGRTPVIKLHPNENLEADREKTQKIVPNAIVVGREITMDELFPVAGVLVNRGNSQTCLDGVLRGIPTVVVACGLKTLFHDDGGAYIVEEVGRLAKTIEAAVTQGTPDGSRVKTDHFYLPPNGVADLIAGEIDAASKRTWPAEESSWNWLIKSMLFMGRHDRALALCERLNPPSPWQKRVREALKAHRETRQQEAISTWMECAVHDPSWFFPHYELAHGFLACGDPEQALDHARRAMELHPPYHTLWHELPMRVVIMAARRKMGDFNAASTELKSLEERGLVSVVPELLIEAAAQHCSFDIGLRDAESCLENAVTQLKRHPVHESADNQIMERTAWQYLEVAKRYADIGELPRSFICLRRTTEIAGSNVALRHRIWSHLGELGERSEGIGNFSVAEKCYTLAIEITPTDHWVRYQSSRVALKQREYRKTLRALKAIAEIPDVPKKIIERALSPADAARFTPYWPQTPMSIVKPLALWLHVSAWFLRQVIRLQFRNTHETVLCLVLVSTFVWRHFVHRLHSESPSQA